MRVMLVNTPWTSIDVPSLAIGILTNSVRQKLPDAEVEAVHANLDFVDWVVDRTEFGLSDYYYYSLFTYFAGCGDWVFSSALYDDPEWRVKEFTDRVRTQMTERELALNIELHRLAPEFVAELADRIVAQAPDVVGFTSTFQQNAAALATARAIKKRAPGIRTVMGGANCDGEQGAAIHRNFSFVDYVVRGEGEIAFPRLLAAIDPARSAVGVAEPAGGLADIEGLCWAGPDGRSVANPMSADAPAAGRDRRPGLRGLLRAAGRVPGPELGRAPAGRRGRPRLLVGREAPLHVLRPQRVVHGVPQQASGQVLRRDHRAGRAAPGAGHVRRGQHPRHELRDLAAAPAHRIRLRPAVAVRDQVEHEGPQLPALADAGLVSVQPGIESLNSRVLKLMDKGVSGCLNVRMLRDAETSGITIAWNYLYGFPGETEADYLPVIAQMPALHHLCPADGNTRIAIERFSPFFVNRRELGFPTCGRPPSTG